MISQILAGILAGTGWLIGWFLYKWAREELAGKFSKVNKKFIYWAILSAIGGLGLVVKTGLYGKYTLNTATQHIFAFAVILLLSSIYATKEKPRHHLVLFAVHSVVFLLAFYLAQVF